MTVSTEAICAMCNKPFLSQKWAQTCTECTERTYRGKSVYLCGPIDGVTPEWATEWRRHVKESLPEWEVLDPTHDKDLTAPGVNDHVYTPEEIVTADLAMVARADVVLVDWRKYMTLVGMMLHRYEPLRVGSICEMWEAHRTGKQVISFGDLRQGYWKRRATDRHFDTLEQAIEYLRGEA